MGTDRPARKEGSPHFHVSACPSGFTGMAAAVKVLEIWVLSKILRVSGESEIQTFQHRILKLISGPNPLRAFLFNSLVK